MGSSVLEVMCSDKNIRCALEGIFRVNGWELITSCDKLLQVNPRRIANYPSWLRAGRVNVDLAAKKENICCVFEVKSRLYAKLKQLRREHRDVDYRYWHLKYYFADPETVAEALEDLRRSDRPFYNPRQDTDSSVAELYQEALGFYIDKGASYKVKINGAVVP